MLTENQSRLLRFIAENTTEGVGPSYLEMMAFMGLKSKGNIHRLIVALEERGFIRRLAHRARAIEVIKLPDDMAVHFLKIASTKQLRYELGLRKLRRELALRLS